MFTLTEVKLIVNLGLHLHLKLIYQKKEMN